MASKSSNAWVSAARPKTLAAAVVPVAVGASIAHFEGVFAWLPVIICLGFAVLVQIGTNYANDYYDFIKGADREDRQGPERAVASGRVKPEAMFKATLGILAFAFIWGLALVAYRGWELLPLGIVCLLFAVAYTGGPFPLAYHGLGDAFVVVFFGWVAVGGTVYVLTGSLPAEVWPAATAIGLMATNLLVINNYRDMDTDARAGKRTLVVRFGRTFAWWQYVLSYVAGLGLMLWLGWWFRSGWFGLPALTMPLAVNVFRRLRTGRGGAELNPLLGQTARVLLLFGLLLSLAFILSGRA